MAATWMGLARMHGGPEKIPDAELYEYLSSSSLRKFLAEQYAKLGQEEFKKFREVPEVRRRTKADLFWMARYFTWETNPEGRGKPIEQQLLTEGTHRPLCDVFVRKDDTKSIAEQDPAFKERMVLYSRGTFKSTVDVVDITQWILNFPKIRVLLVSADEGMITGLLDEVKGHFVLFEDEPSLMNLFFPEFCLVQKELDKENRFQFTCPVWKATQIKRKEPTVMAAPAGSTLSGYHFDVFKADDIVSVLNSGSEDQCRKVIKNFHINKKMLMSFGYLDLIGTRYADEDLYGDELEKNIGDVRKESGLSKPDPRPWELFINPTTGKKILVGRGWLLKPEVEQRLLKNEVKEEALTADDYLLLAPQIYSWAKLRQMRLEQEEVFEGQINQNPRPKSVIVFDINVLKKHTVNFSSIPMNGLVCVTWDFAFSQKKGRDYSTAAVGVYNERGQLYIVDLVHGRFNHTTLAEAVVNLMAKYRPFAAGIEDAAGSRLLEPTILAEAAKRGRPELVDACGKIDWFTSDQQVDAKKQRMASLHPWLNQDRLFFADFLPNLERLYSEFERCLVSHRHDDIPDVISQMLRYAPRVMTTIAKAETPLGIYSRDDLAWNMLFEEDSQGPNNGLLLTVNAETGKLEWVSGYRAPSLLPEPAPEQPTRGETPAPDYGESILGSGLCG